MKCARLGEVMTVLLDSDAAPPYQQRCLIANRLFPSRSSGKYKKLQDEHMKLLGHLELRDVLGLDEDGFKLLLTKMGEDFHGRSVLNSWYKEQRAPGTICRPQHTHTHIHIKQCYTHTHNIL
jgi:hypothetical protein